MLKVAELGGFEPPQAFYVPTLCLANRFLTGLGLQLHKWRSNLDLNQDKALNLYWPVSNRLPYQIRLTAPWRRERILKSHGTLRPLLAVFETAPLPLGLSLHCKWHGEADSDSSLWFWRPRHNLYTITV